jgi:hypothetical protein
MTLITFEVLPSSRKCLTKHTTSSFSRTPSEMYSPSDIPEPDKSTASNVVPVGLLYLVGEDMKLLLCREDTTQTHHNCKVQRYHTNTPVESIDSTTDSASTRQLAFP